MARTTRTSARVACWEDDPGDPNAQPTRVPILVPMPASAVAPLAFKLHGTAPAAQPHAPGTRAFVYHSAACALRRTADFWGAILPSGTRWAVAGVGRVLPVEVDAGVDLNAYYARGGDGYAPGLSFFHKAVGGRVVYSGESPDIVSHEMGHAVLDAIQPGLFDAQAIEAAAFHEAFGDMSALLSALQIPAFRDVVLKETGDRLNHTSRLSRLAEQLAAAIRALRPDVVDPDCLRNASNSFFYRDPETLPPRAPASQLASDPHSFSRVFTGGFLDALAGVFAAQGARTGAHLADTAGTMGRLLVSAIGSAPIVPEYFSQVAAGMVQAGDAPPFNGRYRDALKSAFVRRGLLSLQAAAALTGAVRRPRRRPGLATAAAATSPAAWMAIPAVSYGLKSATLWVRAAAAAKPFSVTGSSLQLGPVEPRSPQTAAQAYTEDLFQRGHVDVGKYADARTGLRNAFAFKTHAVVVHGGALALERRTFNCGFRE